MHSVGRIVLMFWLCIHVHLYPDPVLTQQCGYVLSLVFKSSTPARLTYNLYILGRFEYIYPRSMHGSSYCIYSVVSTYSFIDVWGWFVTFYLPDWLHRRNLSACVQAAPALPSSSDTRYRLLIMHMIILSLFTFCELVAKHYMLDRSDRTTTLY